MVIELTGVQSGLKSYAWFVRLFDLKSQVWWFQTKIARHDVQLPIYYTHFEIPQLFVSILIFIYPFQETQFLKKQNRKMLLQKLRKW